MDAEIDYSLMFLGEYVSRKHYRLSEADQERLTHFLDAVADQWQAHGLPREPQPANQPAEAVMAADSSAWLP